MLIRKTQQPSDYPENQIHDAYSTSATDTYTCNYINKKVIEESGNNYVKYGDGTMICWGTTSVGQLSASSEKRITITLPKSYTNSNYYVFLTKKGEGAYWSYVQETVSSRTSSKFVIFTWNNANNVANLASMDYFTIGKWK